MRDNHKDVGLKDLDWNFEDSYYVDDDGLIHCNSEIKFNRFTNRQLRYNKAQKIPQFGAVAKPRELLRSWELRNYDYPVLLDTNPKLIGNYYCDINGVVLLLPVYHVPEAEDTPDGDYLLDLELMNTRRKRALRRIGLLYYLTEEKPKLIFIDLYI